jgi:predicted transcriptional regulator
MDKSNFTIRLDLALQKQIRRQAVEEELSISEVMESAIRQYLSTRKVAA